MMKSIFHININLTNFDRSLEFYKTLGLKVVLNIGEGTNPANDKRLGIPNSVGRAALFTKSIDEEYARLKGLGVECVSEPVVIQFPNKAGAKFFCLKDPDGTFLELIEPFQNP